MTDILHLYGELTKVEPQPDGSIRLHGVASTGGRDGAGEVVSPDALRKALPGYMAFPALREMHGPKAAGATLHAEVDEAGETRIVAQVVDPVAVSKVKAGVYKGLSIGGRVLERDGEDPSLITAIRLDEISLVDRPCNPEAVIDLWKAAAGSPARSPTNDEVRAEAERMAKAAGRPGRRNDYVAAARAKLFQPPPLAVEEEPGAAAPAGAGTGAHTSRPDPAHQEGDRLHKVVADLQRRLAEQAAEIERLKAEPRPPRAAASALAKGVGKGEDHGGAPAALSPEAFAEALAALPPAERAHLIMKAALSRPISL